MVQKFEKLFTKEMLTKARLLFPHTQKGVIYLNHASISPQSTRVVEAMTYHLNERCCGDINDMGYPRIINSCKFLIQQLIHAESQDRIALTGNTSEAINIVASGLPWQSGDRILLNDIEFPANIYPFLNLRRLGVQIDFVKSENGRVTSEMIENAVTARTRLISLSAVQFLSGYRADFATIGKICREKGIIFFVDGIQAIGAIDLALHIDALAAGCQKWQMGPKGTGFLYITEALQNKIQQQHLGWLAVAKPWEFFNYDQPLSSTASRYEGGTANIPGLWGLEASLKTLLEFGIEAIESHILALTQILLAEIENMNGVKLLSPVQTNKRAGIVTIKLQDSMDSQKFFNSMTSQKIFISLREGMLRFSPHFYNSDEEIEETVEVLKKLIL